MNKRQKKKEFKKEELFLDYMQFSYRAVRQVQREYREYLTHIHRVTKGSEFFEALGI